LALHWLAAWEHAPGPLKDVAMKGKEKYGFGTKATVGVGATNSVGATPVQTALALVCQQNLQIDRACAVCL